VDRQGAEAVEGHACPVGEQLFNDGLVVILAGQVQGSALVLVTGVHVVLFGPD